MRVSSSQRVAEAAERVRGVVEADQRRLKAKLARVDRRIAAGDVHLKSHRRSVARHLAARGGHR